MERVRNGNEREYPLLYRPGEMTESEVYDEVEGSFIILPGTGSHVAPDVDNLDPGTQISINVFQLGQQQQQLTASQKEDQESTLGECSQYKSFECTPNLLSAPTTSSSSQSNAVPTEQGNGDLEEHMKSMISHMSICSTDSTASFEEANCKVTQLLEENMGLRAFVREQNEKQKEFLENCKELEMVIAKSQIEAKEQEQKYDRSRSVIESLRTRIAELESSLVEAENLRKASEGVDYELEIRRLERQLSEKESLLQEEIEQGQKLKELLRKLENELTEVRALTESMTTLQAERDVLSIAFEDSKVTVSKFADIHFSDQEELKELKTSNEALMQQVTETKTLLLEQVNVNKALQNGCHEKSEDIKRLLEKSQIELNRANKLEQSMESTVVELNEIKARMVQMESETQQKISVLEVAAADKNIFMAQMEEYKRDFEEERKEKIALRQQKVELSDELVALQMKLETKEAELRDLHRNHLNLANQHLSSSGATSVSSNQRVGTDDFVVIPSAPSQTTPTGLSGTASDPDEFSCPLCNSVFQNRYFLMAHASNCNPPTVSLYPPARPSSPPSPTPFQYN